MSKKITELTEVTSPITTDELVVVNAGETKRTPIQGILDLVPAGGGAWNLIGTQTAANSASLIQTGLDSTYHTYCIILANCIPNSNGNGGWIRLGDSGGIDSTTNDYQYIVVNAASGATAWLTGGSTGNTDGAMWITGGSVGNETSEGLDATIYLTRPTDGTTFPRIYGHSSWGHEANYVSICSFAGRREAAIIVDRVQFQFKTGVAQINSGRMTVWGISHA